MRIGRSLLAAGLVAILAIWGIGCSDDSTTPATTQGQGEIDLDDQFGGLEADDEQPAFGDPELEAEDDAEITYNDDVAQDLTVMRWESDTGTLLYALTIRWGRLDPSRNLGSGDSSRDWIGRLEVSEGAIRILSLLSWEFSEDEILERVERNLIEWEAHTNNGMDGLRVLIIVPVEEGEDQPENVEVTFVSEPVRRVFSLSELEDYQEVVDVDSDGNQISLRAFRALAYADARGWTSGRWIYDEEQEIGTFAGRWVVRDPAGGRIGYTSGGYVRGHYGVSSEGEQVFFGKVIDRSGRFQGFLRGNWALLTEGEHRRAGTFSGQFLTRNGDARGIVRGTWRQAIGGSPGWYEGILATSYTL
jgi:hypothetical protein